MPMVISAAFLNIFLDMADYKRFLDNIGLVNIWRQMAIPENILTVLKDIGSC